jgi:hypothetical protein
MLGVLSALEKRNNLTTTTTNNAHSSVSPHEQKAVPEVIVSCKQIAAHVKHAIARQLDWSYVKCTSRKRFKAAYDASPKLAALIDSGWKCFLVDVPKQQITECASVWTQHKYDDFVDTLLLMHFLLFALDNKKSAQTAKTYKNTKTNKPCITQNSERSVKK